MQRYRLHQSIPWSQADLWAFLIACIASGASIAVWAWIIADPGKPSGAALAFVFGAGIPVVMNAPNLPVKQLRWYLQYPICVLLLFGSQVYRTAMGPYFTTLEAVLYHVVAGSMLFLLFRINWWFLWDNPSRRITMEKALLSVFYTGVVPPLGVVMGLWRLVGIGVLEPTTEFHVVPVNPHSMSDGKILETIRESPALAEHARRMEAIRSAQVGTGSGRKPSENKDRVSGSI